jgi:hypothetical protein
MEVIIGWIMSAGTLVSIFTVVIVGAAWNGVVLSILWGWFITPLGVPSIGIAQGIGISLIISTLITPRAGRVEPKEHELSDALAHLVGWFLASLGFLGVGWFLTLAMNAP